LVRRRDVRQGFRVWRYVYRAVDQHGQVIDVYVSHRRDTGAARTFFTAALAVHDDPGEVVTDRAPALANVIEDLVPAALHNTGQHENNRVHPPCGPRSNGTSPPELSAPIATFKT